MSKTFEDVIVEQPVMDIQSRFGLGGCQCL